MEFKPTITHVVDCGQSSGAIFDGTTNKVKKISHTELLDLPETLPVGSFVVGEAAHYATPRGLLSKAQPFHSDKLLLLYERFEEHGITFRFFPQKSTPQAQGYMSEKFIKDPSIKPEGVDLSKWGDWIKNDPADTVAIYHFLSDHPHLIEKLMRPRKKFHTDETPDPYRQEIYEFKKHTNRLLNAARNTDPQTEQIYIDAASSFIRDNIDYILDNISDTAKDMFEVQYYQQSRPTYAVGDVKIDGLKWNVLASVASVLIDADGSDRVRSRGEAPGCDWVKRNIFCLTPHHQKGGVAASNIKYHGRRNWVATQVNRDLKIDSQSPYATVKCSLNGHLKTRDKEGREGKAKPVMTAEQKKLFLHYRTIYDKEIMNLYRLLKDMRQNGVPSMPSVSSEVQLELF